MQQLILIRDGLYELVWTSSSKTLVLQAGDTPHVHGTPWPWLPVCRSVAALMDVSPRYTYPAHRERLANCNTASLSPSPSQSVQAVKRFVVRLFAEMTVRRPQQALALSADVLRIDILQRL